MYIALWNTPQVERLLANGHAVYYAGNGWYHSAACPQCTEDRRDADGPTHRVEGIDR